MAIKGILFISLFNIGIFTWNIQEHSYVKCQWTESLTENQPEIKATNCLHPQPVLFKTMADWKECKHTLTVQPIAVRKVACVNIVAKHEGCAFYLSAQFKFEIFKLFQSVLCLMDCWCLSLFSMWTTSTPPRGVVLLPWEKGHAMAPPMPKAHQRWCVVSFLCNSAQSWYCCCQFIHIHTHFKIWPTIHYSCTIFWGACLLHFRNSLW